ncbi:membrane magnesium transporter-like isoform X1 [Populus alba x Populus x berolinensis]|nr:membrane magnesium transporter-like isoform X1 [Populus alba x Populus x berolinensis]
MYAHHTLSPTLSFLYLSFFFSDCSSFLLFLFIYADGGGDSDEGLLKITEDEFSGPPFNVVVELIVGLVLCTWAAITVPGIFLSIHPNSDDNRMVSLPDSLDFIIFNHRGKVFVPEINMKSKR